MRKQVNVGAALRPAPATPKASPAILKTSPGGRRVCVRILLSPLRGCVVFSFYPGLAPWPVFLRRFAATKCDSVATAVTPTPSSPYFGI